MKLLFITMVYPTPSRPRQGMFNLKLVEALAVEHEVRVIAPIPWTQRRVPTPVDVPDVDPRVLHPRFVYPPKVLRHRYHVFYWYSIFSSLIKLESSFVPDIVIGYWLHPDGAAAIKAAKRFGTPCLLFSGGTDLLLLSNCATRRRAIQRVLSHSDRLIVVSRDLARKAIELGMNADDIDVVYRGVDRRCFQPADQGEARDACQIARDAVVVMWSGRLEPVKNPRMLLHAAAHWRTKWGDRLSVRIAGEGSMKTELLKLRSQLRLGNHVHFDGNLSPEELAVRYNAADVMVLTSHSEGIPNVLLEAISCGLRFVATDVGGVSEIASPEMDQLIADDDLDALVQSVVKQVESPAQSKRTFVPDGLAQMAARFNVVVDRVMAGSGEARQ